MTRTTTAKGNLYVVSAPSGAGKTSLLKNLISELGGIEASVSHTTRARREKEVEGVDYYFVSTAEFESLIEAEAFFEHAKVFGNYYGTSIAALERQLDKGVDVILEIDWQGARQIKQCMPRSRTIFILPPSKQALLERLQSRDQDDKAVIYARMQEAQNEMSHYLEYDYLIINDDFLVAASELKAILVAERQKLRIQKQKHAHLLSNLLE